MVELVDIEKNKISIRDYRSPDNTLNYIYIAIDDNNEIMVLNCCSTTHKFQWSYIKEDQITNLLVKEYNTLEAALKEVISLKCRIFAIENINEIFTIYNLIKRKDI